MRAVSGWIVGNYMQCTPGSSARTHGTAVPQESGAQTEQHMLGHRFPAWYKSTGLSFIPNVSDLHERTTVTQPQRRLVYHTLIDRISYFTCIPHPPPPFTRSHNNLMMIAALERRAYCQCSYSLIAFSNSDTVKSHYILLIQCITSNGN